MEEQAKALGLIFIVDEGGNVLFFYSSELQPLK